MRDRTGFFVRRSNPIATVLAFLFSLIVLVLLLTPILAIGVIILLWIIIRSVFGLFVRSKQPNGVFDGRKNVRVRMPNDHEEKQ